MGDDDRSDQLPHRFRGAAPARHASSPRQGQPRQGQKRAESLRPAIASAMVSAWIGNAVVVEVAPSGWVVNTSLVAVPKAFTVWVGLSEPEKAEWFVSPP